jgi:hypothetical protein
MSWWKYVGGLTPGPAAIPNPANPRGLAARLLRTRPAHRGHHLVGARRGPRNVLIERGDGTQVRPPVQSARAADLPVPAVAAAVAELAL